MKTYIKEITRDSYQWKTYVLVDFKVLKCWQGHGTTETLSQKYNHFGKLFNTFFLKNLHIHLGT